jgi:valyl-tRNA synthetase
LSNEEFVGRAPAAVIEKERTKLKEAEEKLVELDKRLQ